MPSLSVLARPGVLAALYAGNAAWFSSAFIHFAFRGSFIMRKLTIRPKGFAEGDAWHHDILEYLGGINTGFALLAGLRVYTWWQGQNALKGTLSTGDSESDIPLDVIALSTLCLANFSQAYLNFMKSRRNGRWIMGKGFDRITVLDAVFTVLDALALLARLRQRRMQ